MDIEQTLTKHCAEQAVVALGNLLSRLGYRLESQELAEIAEAVPDMPETATVQPDVNGRLGKAFPTKPPKRTAPEFVACSIQGCGKRSYSRGFCRLHYRMDTEDTGTNSEG